MALEQKLSIMEKCNKQIFNDQDRHSLSFRFAFSPSKMKLFSVQLSFGCGVRNLLLNAYCQIKQQTQLAFFRSIDSSFCFLVHFLSITFARVYLLCRFFSLLLAFIRTHRILRTEPIRFTSTSHFP